MERSDWGSKHLLLGAKYTGCLAGLALWIAGCTPTNTKTGEPTTTEASSVHDLFLSYDHAAQDLWPSQAVDGQVRAIAINPEATQTLN